MIVYELYINYSNEYRPRLVYKSNEPDDYPIFSLKYKVEVNKTGSCTFVVSTAHPLYDSFSEMNTFVYVVVRYIKNGVIQHNYCPFIGRIIEISEDEMDNKECTCEGIFGTLNDTFGRVRYEIGARTSEDIYYTNRCLFNMFGVHTSWHWIDYPIQKLYAEYSDAPYVDEWGTYWTYFDCAWWHPNIENVTYAANDGVKLSDQNNEDDIYKDDSSIKSLYEMAFNIALKKSGGFFLPVYDPFDRYGDVTMGKCLWTYNSYKMADYGGTNLHTLINYPNESYPEIEDPFTRWTWLPYFSKGENIVALNKESMVKTKYNAVLPVGKDNLSMYGDLWDEDFYFENSPEDFLIIDENVISPYKSLLPIVVNFEDVSYTEDLRSSGEAWLSTHIRDADLPPKYTITGPEPCGVGCGDKLIMLMRDVIVREDPSEELVNSTMLPCLSMEIDVENPQSNVYVVGPFIDDNYSETNISSK